MIDNSDNAVFRKVDIFEHRDLLDQLGVTSLPTFKIWVNGELYDSQVGTDLDTLNQTIENAIAAYSGDSAAFAQSDSTSLAAKLAALF